VEHVVIQDLKQTYGNITSLDVLCRCRLSKHPPFSKVKVGDTVYVQEKGGPIKAKATVSKATSKEYSDISEIRELCKSSRLYNATDYWALQKGRRYGTVIWLENHQLVSPPIARRYVKGNANDWIVLDSLKKRGDWPGL
jgi:hypothetical protein